MELIITRYDGTFQVRLKVSHYRNGCLEVTLFFHGDKFSDTWMTITADLADLELPPCDKDCAYIDPYFVGQEILDWLAQNKIATPTKRTDNYGGYTYPMYQFDPEILKSLDPEGYAEYIEHWERCNIGDEDE